MHKEKANYTQFANRVVELGRDINLSKDDLDRYVQQTQKELGISDFEAQKILKQHIAKSQAEMNKLDVDRQQLTLDIQALESTRNSNLTGSERIQQFKDRFPDTWNKVAQRIYKHTDSYGNYRLAYLEWGWAFQMLEWNKRRDAEQSQQGTEACQQVVDTFNLHKEHNFPFFFVSKGICDAAWQSDLKFQVEWKTMRLPFEAFTFVLPKDNSVGYEAVIVCRYIKDGDVKLELSALKSDQSLGHRLSAEYPFEMRDEGDHLLRWVFNTIFAMSARPEYVESGERLGTKKGTQSELWSPNVIGRKYAIKSHTFAKASGGSVRLHWRRGHFRQQAYGIGLTQRRIIWIEPMMVGAK